MNVQNIDVRNEPLAVRTLYPRESFWKTHQEKLDEKRDLMSERVSRQNTVIVHDTDADGLGTAVLLKEEHPEAALIPRGHSEDVSISEVGQLLSSVLSEGGRRVIITDNGCDSNVGSYVDPYVETFDEVFIYDHHQWPDGAEEYLEENNVEFVLDETRCATQIVHDEYVTDPPEHLTEFSRVTQDHDLWIKEDARSDSLANCSYALDSEKYINLAVEHGVGLIELNSVRDELIEQRRITQEKLNLALQRAEFYNIGDITLALTYGRCPKSDTGSVLYGEYGADIVCMMFPSGKLSFRSADNGYALEMAKTFNGGGHPDAAGGYLKDTIVEGDVAYESYWGTMGKCVHEHVVQKVEEKLLE